jgi:hypothetical protein
MRNTLKKLVENLERMRPHGRTKVGWEYDGKINLST